MLGKKTSEVIRDVMFDRRIQTPGNICYCSLGDSLLLVRSQADLKCGDDYACQLRLDGPAHA